MKKFYFALLALGLMLPISALAQAGPNIRGNLGTAGKAGFGTDRPASLTEVIGSIITTLLGFTATIALVFFIYGGFLWLTDRGNEDQVAKAKTIIRNSTIGIIVIMLAYSLTFFVTEVLFSVTTS